MEPTFAEPEARKSRPLRLKAILQELHRYECPEVPNPSICKKRASVALIIRVRPTFPHKPVYDPKQCASSGRPFQECLENFFSQTWVQEGDPEILFIKRAARAGDRWTSHVALPGGKREPADSDDRATSARETREETGLEVDIDHCLFIGNLPQRLVTTTWGKVPLMVLCPFVYLLMRHDLPPLALQPTEVHSSHWVPMRGLLSPSLRTFERCDISERFAKKSSPVTRMAIRAIAGQLLFGAIELKPIESLYCDSNSITVLQNSTPGTWLARVLDVGWLKEDRGCDGGGRSLILWGLTLGITADFLELLDPDGATGLWTWPTFSPWDIRTVIWLLTHNFRSRRLQEAGSTSNKPDDHESCNSQIGGLDTTTFTTKITRRGEGLGSGLAGGHLLDGYTDRLRRAVIVALLMRLGFGAVLTFVLVRKYRQKIG